LYYAFVRHNITVHIFGDINQIEPVNETVLDVNAPYLKQMCPTVNELEYIEASGRYTKTMHTILNQLLTEGVVATSKFQDLDDSMTTNMCYTNAQRQKVTSRLATDGVEMEFDYHLTKGKEKYKVKVGMKMICTTNEHKHINMFNSSFHIVTAINPGTVTLKYEFGDENIITRKEFCNNFIPAYCSTVHKYQGKTVTEPYNIYEAHRMSRNQLYTSLSRPLHEGQIHIGMVKEYYPEQQPDTTQYLLQLIDPGKFRHSKIYRIDFEDGHFYIGYTTQSLEKRLEQHKDTTKSQMTEATRYHKDTGLEPTIRLLHQYPCFTKQEIEVYEYRVIQHYKKEDPDNILNKRSMKDGAPVEPTWKTEVKVEVKRHIRDVRFKILEDEKEQCFYIDKIVDGKRMKAKARYGKRHTREEAYQQINEKAEAMAEEQEIAEGPPAHSDPFAFSFL
jgi:predicted GIY-YIG superfamily endonuclease